LEALSSAGNSIHSDPDRTDVSGRGAEDILIAMVDKLKGFPQATTAVSPVVQICIVHLIRYSMKLASSSNAR
jgi:transposase-like protein